MELKLRRIRVVEEVVVNIATDHVAVREIATVSDDAAAVQGAARVHVRAPQDIRAAVIIEYGVDLRLFPLKDSE
ncbi:hypothetical protein COOONC_16730 [Cooperia oncophora]